MSEASAPESPRRGEIWIAVWPNDPARKPCPVLIVSNDHRNSATGLADAVVVKLTGLHRKDGSTKPVHAFEDVLATFKKESIIRCGAIYSIEKSMLVRKQIDLPAVLMSKVDSALRIVLGLESERINR